MKNHDIGTSIVLFLLGVFIIFYAPMFSLGKMSTPGPGFMPFWTGIMICILSMIMFLQAVFNGRAKMEEIWAGVRVKKLLLVVTILVIYVLLFKPIGFLISTFILILFLIRLVEPQRWIISILGGVFSSILSYLLFETWLKAQLPRGILGF